MDENTLSRSNLEAELHNLHSVTYNSTTASEDCVLNIGWLQWHLRLLFPALNGKDDSLGFFLFFLQMFQNIMFEYANESFKHLTTEE